VYVCTCALGTLHAANIRSLLCEYALLITLTLSTADAADRVTLNEESTIVELQPIKVGLPCMYISVQAHAAFYRCSA
jgi:hypothetical protein